MMEYRNDLLRYATEHSNRIENEPTTGQSFDNHLRATLLVRRAAEVNQLLHPRVLHQLLFDGFPNSKGIAPNVPGEYRIVRVFVNQPGGRKHFFPEPNEVPALMNSWWMTACTFHQAGMGKTHAEMRWKFHAWFEAIHPDTDGNGRVGRLLWWNMAMIAGQPIEVIAYEERNAYYDRLELWREVYGNRTHMNPF